MEKTRNFQHVMFTLTAIIRGSGIHKDFAVIVVWQLL